MKKILLALLAVFLIIQAFRPKKNLSNDQTHHVATKYNIPAELNTLLEGACYDCHSNKTHYPWYSEIQPAAWFLAGHVKEGKEHLNFSNFTSRKIAVQYHKFEEIIELVDEEEMPLPSYTWFGLHPEADISRAQRQQIIDWANAQMIKLRSEYPADSLVRSRR